MERQAPFTAGLFSVLVGIFSESHTVCYCGTSPLVLAKFNRIFIINSGS